MAPLSPCKLACCLAVLAVGARAQAPPSHSYSSVILGSASFNVTVFTPAASDSENVYYNATRFDWSTQIGNVKIGPYLLFANDFWRGYPHDPTNAEAAVGLASEFGCGDYW